MFRWPLDRVCLLVRTLNFAPPYGRSAARRVLTVAISALFAVELDGTLVTGRTRMPVTAVLAMLSRLQPAE